MNNPDKLKKWAKKITEFNKSRKTKEIWCEENKISTRQLNYWLRQLENNSKNENPSTKWLPVEIAQEKSTKNSSLFVKIGNISIEVSTGFDKELLAEVLNTLKSL